MTDDIKWQPIMLILNRRLECSTCQALAIFVTGDLAEDGVSMTHVEAWCQICFSRAQETNDDDRTSEDASR